MPLLLSGTAVVFFAMMLVTPWHLRWVRRSPALDRSPAQKARVRCSVVIAARDEEARIEQSVRRLRAREDVELERIFAHDPSRDRTGGSCGGWRWEILASR